MSRLRACSRANFALLLRQHITRSANRGNPKMQDTIGITTVSGDTVNKISINIVLPNKSLRFLKVDLLGIVLV